MKKTSFKHLLNSSTLKHLRFPFSFFLMPVYFFALSQANEINLTHALLTFAMLHVFIFPSSNGYNSYQDKDVSSIGGLKNPPKVSKKLFYITLLFDALALVLALFISSLQMYLVLAFIIMSRLYSYRKIRLKKFPVISFLIVALFQGGLVYLISLNGFAPNNLKPLISFTTLICMTIASLFIGSMYPLTQIYQHEADLSDGVKTISYKLGYLGTFAFSAGLFVGASLLLLFYFTFTNKPLAYILFLFLIIPMLIHLFKWTQLVKTNHSFADFEHTMKTNLITSITMNGYFLLLFIGNTFHWF